MIVADTNLAVYYLICQSGDCSSYDAEFIWLAREHDVPLVAADAALIGAFPSVAVHPSSLA